MKRGCLSLVVIVTGRSSSRLPLASAVVLVAPDSEGHALVLQADHAVMTGRIADVWSAEALGGRPHPAVARAAYGHELGWDSGDPASLNEATGLPFSSLELPLEHHLPMQLDGPRRLGESDPDAGLLASLKHSNRYRDPALPALIKRKHRLTRRFLEDSKALQSRLREESTIAPEQEEWSWHLVDACDRLSHFVIMHRERMELDISLPDGKGSVRFTARRHPDHWTAEPWPFGVDRLHLTVNARIVEGTFGSQEDLDAAVQSSEVVERDYLLIPSPVDPP